MKFLNKRTSIINALIIFNSDKIAAMSFEKKDYLVIRTRKNSHDKIWKTQKRV